MAQSQEIAELWKVIRDVEHLASNHVSECGIRNIQREKWEAQTVAEIAGMRLAIHKLNISEARQAGWFAGASAVGGVVGAALATVVSKLLNF